LDVKLKIYSGLSWSDPENSFFYLSTLLANKLRSNSILTREESVLIAAGVAAIVSIINLAVNLWSSRIKEQRGAYREALETSFTKLGELLYEIVSLSNKLSKMKTAETFATIRRNAEDSAKKLDHLRRKTIYPLWGLSSSIQTIQKVPLYIAHTKNTKDQKRIKKILFLATKLRKSIDKVVMRSYISGAPPTRLNRSVVKYRAKKLRNYFDKSNPNNNNG
jgi:hypothetical protein